MLANTLTTVTVKGVSYYIPSHCKGFIDESLPWQGIATPAWIIGSGDSNQDPHKIWAERKQYTKEDDVCSEDFFKIIVVQGHPGRGRPTKLLRKSNLLKGGAVNPLILQSTPQNKSRVPLPSGPYFIIGRGIYEAWRLYADTFDCFEIAVLQNTTNSVPEFRALTLYSDDGLWRAIAVPSRHYAQRSHDKPLAGLRVSVKDNFKLRGIKSTMTSRAFTSLYGVDTETAHYVNKLISLGAIIVGKTRMAAFAAGEEPTDQYIDFHCPFNPRGDCYQSPGSSSSGAAASLAAYPWLDIAIGTDTAGSIRVPAANNGLYGLRPSFEATPLDGVYRLARAFDTVGLLSRELSLLQKLVKFTLSKANENEKFPRRILYPEEFFPTDNSEQQAMIDSFVARLEDFLEVKRESFSIADKWSRRPPKAAESKSFKDYLSDSVFWQYYYDAYHEYDTFRQDYRKKFGNEPYVGPLVKYRWEKGRAISKQRRDQGESELRIFREWFNNTIMKEDPYSLSDAILILPEGKSGPDYRDDRNPDPSILSILGENTLAMVLELPHLVLPIDQLSYHSRVTDRDEYKPICGSLVGAKGSELMLVNLAKNAFEQARWPTKLETGRTVFLQSQGNLDDMPFADCCDPVATDESSYDQELSRSNSIPEQKSRAQMKFLDGKPTFQHDQTRKTWCRNLLNCGKKP